MYLPEKVLQFGTGILLRGLPDFFIDKANKQGIFNGKILVVKSTTGSTKAFSDAGFQFDTYVRGIEKGKVVEENFSNESISRVLSATDDWQEILNASHNSEMQIIISNTTEVGLQYTEESIFLTPPRSFPGKLTAFLYERYKIFGDGSPDVVVIPTELIPGNGEKLRAIVEQLISFNKLEHEFSSWMKSKITFCNSLVDRIVTRPSTSILQSLKRPNPLAIQTEPYRLWAIEGDQRIRDVLSFSSADPGVIINEKIDYYRERKLRLLNGTHTISVCLGFLLGHDTVYECMEDTTMHSFIKSVMMDEIQPTLTLGSESDNVQFGKEVLDRFHNPFSQHKLLSITLQATMKMRMRNIPTIIAYFNKFGKVPPLFAKGFAAYLLFMKAEKVEEGKYFGRRKNDLYHIQDDAAEYFFEQWQTSDIKKLVSNVFGNKRLWDVDLTLLPGFVEAVSTSLMELQNR